MSRNSSGQGTRTTQGAAGGRRAAGRRRLSGLGGGPLVDPWFILGLCGASALLLAWCGPLWGGATVFYCPFRLLTGIPCPLCGGTRAWLAAARGDLTVALALNPAVALATTVLLAAVPVLLAAPVAGWSRSSMRSFGALRPGIVGLAAAAVVVVNWLFVVASGTV